MEVTITLPYLPPQEFSGNFRGHWAIRYQAGEKVKTDVIALVREQTTEQPRFKSALVDIAWGLPDRRRRDWDNLLAATKPVLDGLVAANVIEDDSVRHINLRLSWFTSPRKPVCRITVRESRVETFLAQPEKMDAIQKILEG